MLYKIDAITGYFIHDAPEAKDIASNIVSQPPLNPDGTGMMKPKWIGTWDNINKTWINNGWIDEEAGQLENDLVLQEITNIENVIDLHIKSIARSKGYNSTESCASYSNSTNTQWKAEADAFIAKRDEIWAYVVQELAKVNAGTRTLPTPEEAVIEVETLFPMVWP